VFAIFDPNRYDIEHYPSKDGYDVKLMRDRFRSLLMLKNSDDAMAPRVGLRFDGLNEEYYKLPRYDTEKDALQKVYDEMYAEDQKKALRKNEQMPISFGK